MARRGIICGGSWCVDRNKLIDHWPEQETIAGIVAEERQGGGNGANASVDLKRLGAPFPVEAAGLLGADSDLPATVIKPPPSSSVSLKPA